MTYQQTHEEDYQSINEDTFDDLYNKSENALKNIRENLQSSYNPYILSFCSPYDLMKLVENGEFELPEHYWTSGRVDGKKTDNLVYISDPVIYESEEEDLSGWMTITANGLVPTYQTINEKEEEVKQQEEKLEQIRAHDENNKHNWTMTREERGLPKTQPKPVKKESRASKRRQRRFKINKSTPIRPNLKTIQKKPKSKYQPKRIAHKPIFFFLKTKIYNGLIFNYI